MVLKIFCIRILWLTVSYAADKSMNAAPVIILVVLSEVQELAVHDFPVLNPACSLIRCDSV